MALCRRIQLRSLFYNPLISNAILQESRCCDVIFKVLDKGKVSYPFLSNGYAQKCDLGRFLGGGSVRYFRTRGRGRGECEGNGVSDNGLKEVEQKGRPKGKRAMIKWLKRFRYKKRKEYESMTPEEKIVWKLQQARKKKERLEAAIARLEPKENPETRHDPEILTPEEHFYFLNMGRKCKNYVPVGRRGMFQGVLLNMHLHWKKHQTLQVIVKTFPPEEVKEIAVELARLSGGIVLDIQEKNTIIMYRGKNYSQPPTEIMSPRCTLPRIKAFKKSKYLDALRAVRLFIPRLQERLDILTAQAGTVSSVPKDKPTDADNDDLRCASDIQFKSINRLKELIAKTEELIDKTEVDNEIEDSEFSASDTEDLSDIFETESEGENDDDDDKVEQHLYLDEFEKFPVNNNEEEAEDFEDHPRQISADARKEKSEGRSGGLRDLDEVDRMVLRAASSFKKKGR